MLFGDVQRCLAILVLCFDVNLVFDQELDDVEVAVLTGPVQWCPAVVVF